MNILVVEDDRDIREMVSQSLAQYDFRITGCSNLAEARTSITH
jgi:DNA-binding response OmpR family regulator